MAGEDAVLTIGASVAGALAGITAVQFAFKSLDAVVISSTAIIRSASLAMIGVLGAVGVALGAVAVLGLRGSIKEFEEYEQQVANAASVTGTYGQEYMTTMKNIDKVAKEVGASTIFTATQTANAIYDIASAGIAVTALTKEQLVPIMNLAAATQSDLTQTTEIMTATMGQFGLGIEDTVRIADAFAWTIGNSKATLEKIGLSFKYAGNIAKSFGDDIEGVSAGLAVMFNNGLKGEQAGRALRIAYGRMANPTQAMVDILDELNLGMEAITITSEYGMNDALEKLAASGMDVGQAMKFFGVEAGTGMNALTQQIPLLRYLEEGLYGAGGAAEDMAHKQLDTLRGSFILLGSVIDNMKLEIGQRFAPFIDKANFRFRDLVLTLTDLVQPSFEKFMAILKMLEPTIRAVVLIAKSVYGIFLDIADMLPSASFAIWLLVHALNTVAIAFAVVMRFIDEHPKITQYTLAIIAAVVAFSWLYPALVVVYGAVQTLSLVFWLLAAVMTGAIIPDLAAINALLLGIEWPIVLIAAAIAVLAAVWIFNIGGMRDSTYNAVKDIKDYFWDLVDKSEHYINVIAGMYNDLMDKLGIDAPRIGLIDWEDYAKDSFQKVKDVFTMDTSISDYLKLPDIGLEDLMSAKTIYEDIRQTNEDIANSMNEQVAATVRMNDLNYSYFGSLKDRETKKGSGRYETPNDQEFSSYAEVKAAKEAGTLGAGDIYHINIEKVTVSEDGEDELTTTITDARRQVGSALV